MNTVTIWLAVILLTPLFVTYSFWAWSLKGIRVKEVSTHMMKRAMQSMQSLPWIGIVMIGLMAVLLATLLFFLVVFIF